MDLTIVGSDNTLPVSDVVFGREFSEALVHQVVVAYRNTARSGTKAQKSRSQVSGTTKKSKKQKRWRRASWCFDSSYFCWRWCCFCCQAP